MAVRWRRLDAIIAGTHRLSSRNRGLQKQVVHNVLLGIVDAYLLQDERDAALEALRAFAVRHPAHASDVAKMRAEVKRWGATASATRSPR